MKKLKIAIIDDGIDRNIVKEYFENIFVETAKPKETVGFTHGTACTLLLLEFFQQCTILDLPVVSSEIDEMNYINVIRSLETCFKKKVDIICMSIGSFSTETAKLIKPIIYRLIKKKIIIIAASANNNVLTFPAVFDGVLGVKYDKLEYLNPGTFIYIDKPIDGINFYATLPKDSDIMKVLKKSSQYSFHKSNSAIVPYIASIIGNTIVGNNKKYDCSPNYIFNKYTYIEQNLIEYNKNILNKVLIIHIGQCRLFKLLNKKLQKDNFSTLFYGENIEDDFSKNYISADRENYLRKLIYFANIIYPDIVFIYQKQNIDIDIDFDLLITNTEVDKENFSDVFIDKTYEDILSFFNK